MDSTPCPERQASSPTSGEPSAPVAPPAPRQPSTPTPASSSVIHSLATLLDEIGLGHLEQLLCGESLSICLLRLSEGRPAFLRYLKDLGVSQLTERQRLANKLGRALREGRVPADLVVTTDQPPCDTEVLEEAMAALDVLCDPVVTEASRQALLLELGLEAHVKSVGLATRSGIPQNECG